MYRTGGFTLLEALVSIAIVAILVAVAVPLLARGREKTRQAACANNLYQMGKATQVYLAENRHKSPPLFFSFSWSGDDLLVTVVPRSAIESGWGIFDPKAVVCPRDAEPSLVPLQQSGGQVQWDPASFGLNIEILVQDIAYDALRRPGDLAWFYDGMLGKSQALPDTGSGTVQGRFEGTDDFVSKTFSARHPVGAEVGQVLFADWRVAPVEQVSSEQVLVPLN